MRHFVYSKLVRNKILDDMLRQKELVRYHILDDRQYLRELQKKILEETSEIDIENNEKLLSELADLQEVINSMLSAINKKPKDLKAIQDKKNAQFGSFDKKVYIDTVAVSDDNPWISYLEENSDRYPEFDIYKAAGIIIRDRRLLVEKSNGKDIFMAPGGKLEPDETPKQALVRELKEEVQLTVKETDLEDFGTFYAEAAGSHDAGKRMRMDVFFVHNATGDILPDNEVEEVRWISSNIDPDIELGSVFAHEVIPRLKNQKHID
jgi:8-oxo-dGTP diphosphatase